MPFYTWMDKNSGKEVEVVREFKDYETPPTEEESGISPEKASWERLIRGKRMITRPRNWGSKGYWILVGILYGTFLLSGGTC